MRVLLDECLPVDLRHRLAVHEAHTAEWAGLKGLANGELLKAAEEAGYDVLLTADQGIPHQQNVASLKIAVVVLRSKTNQLEDLIPLMDAVLAALDAIHPGSIVRVG